MARLLAWTNAGETSVELLNGPMAAMSGSSQAMSGFEQSFEGIGDVIVMRFTLNAKQGTAARRERGLFLGLHGGANATRVEFFDPDRMTYAEAGGVGTGEPHLSEEGNAFDTGNLWQPGYPRSKVAAAAGFDTGIVTLQDIEWGHDLGVGDVIGFVPEHFGIYWITEVFEPGRYRVWPRLRKPLAVGNPCILDTLCLVMRPMGRDAITGRRGLAATEDTSIILHEVIDPYVRRYYAG